MNTATAHDASSDRNGDSYQGFEIQALYQALVPPTLRSRLKNRLPLRWSNVVQVEEEGLQTALIRWTRSETAAKAIAPALYFLSGKEYQKEAVDVATCVNLHPGEGVLIIGEYTIGRRKIAPVLVVGYHPRHGSDVQALVGIAAYDDFSLALKARIDASGNDATRRLAESVADISRLVLPCQQSILKPRGILRVCGPRR